MPFLRSKPGTLLTLTTFSVIALGILFTLVPLGRDLGFTPLPWQFFLVLLLFIVAYLLLVEVTKKIFYADPLHLPLLRTPPASISARSSAAQHGSAILLASAGTPSDTQRSLPRWCYGYRLTLGVTNAGRAGDGRPEILSHCLAECFTEGGDPIGAMLLNRAA